jgi:hypothetical protein
MSVRSGSAPRESVNPSVASHRGHRGHQRAKPWAVSARSARSGEQHAVLVEGWILIAAAYDTCAGGGAGC